MVSESKFGYLEVADTLGDIVEAAASDGVVSAFPKDSKFEVFKLLIEVVEEYPNIVEMIDDFDTFWREAKDLDTTESQEVIKIIKARFANPSPVQAKIIQTYDNLNITYNYVRSMVLGGGEEVVQAWKAL